MRRAQRSRTMAVTLRVTAAAALLGWVGGGRGLRVTGRATVVEAAGALRPVEACLAGMPYAALRSSRRLSLDDPHLRRLAARLGRAASHRPSPEELSAWGFLLLLAGGRAVPVLERAVVADPSDAAALNDLGAAYLDLASPEQPIPYLRALDAFDRALALQPALAAARFNRALALERLTLRRPARVAWQRYLQLEGESGWAAEARRHLRDLDTPSDAELWERGLPALEADALAGRQPAVAAAVRRSPQLARLHVEERLLPAWAAACLSGRASAAAQELAVARAIGRALADHGGDAMAWDAVAAIDHVREAAAPRPSSRIAALAAGHAAYGLALDLYQKKDFAGAARELRRARSALTQGRSPFASAAAYQLARCSYVHAAYPAALQSLQRILAQAAPARHLALAGRAHWLTGTILLAQGRPSESLDHYRQALSLFEALAETGNGTMVQSLIAGNLDLLGETAIAWQYRYRALLGLLRLDDLWVACGVVGDVAAATSGVGEAAVGLYFQDELIALTRAAGEPADIATALRQRASLDQGLGRTATALRDLDEAAGWLDRIADPDARAIATGETLFAEGLIRSAGAGTGALAALDRALAFMTGAGYRLFLPDAYLARARVLLRQDEGEHAMQSLATGIAECERQRVTVDAGHRVSWLGRAQELYAEMVRLQLALRHDPKAAFAYLERGRARALLDMFGDLGHVAAPAVLPAAAGDLLDAPSLRRELPAGTVVVEYQLSGGELLIWTLARETAAFRRLPVDRQALLSVARRLAGAARSGDAGDFTAAASAGYLWLISPVRDLISGKSLLVVVPDPSLASVPYGALRDPASGRHLIADLAVAVAPSANVFARCRRRAGAMPGLVTDAPLAVGGPALPAEPFSTLPRLPRAGAEAQSVATILGHARLLLDRQATKGAFLAAAPTASLVHFAGHALRNEANPRFSSLLFAASGAPGDSGVLYAHELLGRRFARTRLVVLSGCETSIGPASSSEAALGLSISFLTAGVPTVIGTLWQADDFASDALFQRFYHHLAADADAAGAL